MNIYVAIDIKNGIVVKAFAGIRNNYTPLIINKKDFSDPFFLIRVIKKNFNIKKFYIADLDSINGSKNNWFLLKKILFFFSNLEFILDLGINHPKKLWYFKSFKRKEFPLKNNYTFIICTELLFVAENLVRFRNKQNLILSIDFNGREDQWLRKINHFTEFKQVILMFIKNVGGRGINWCVLKNIKKSLSPRKTIVAGGIKYNGDLRILSLKGYDSVVVSSLIHKKIGSMGEKSPKDFTF
mgnify:CR=1 FL=1